jgi:hypothetical protein
VCSLPERAPLVTRGPDGCYHPATEAELAAVVRHASAAGGQLRVMGSTHSVWRAIVTDRFDGASTPAHEFTVVLDRYVTVFEAKPDPSNPDGRLVEVQAGCHIGLAPARPVQARMVERPAPSSVREPSPWHDGSWENSLTATLHHRDGLALPDLGGISHQTIAGYISTGSAGGTVKWSIHDAIARLRVIDAAGCVTELTPDGGDPDWFHAAGVGMGLCGVISTITFRCIPTFDIVGRESVSAASRSDDLDFYGERPASGLPSLEQFLLDTDYARLMWWPQRKFDRLVVWQARRAPFEPRRRLRPYREIAHFPVASQVAASIVYTVLGNLDRPERTIAHVTRLRQARSDVNWNDVAGWLRRLFTWPVDPSHGEGMGPPPGWPARVREVIRGDRRNPVVLGAAWLLVVEYLVTVGDDLLADAIRLPLLRALVKRLARLVPEHIDRVLDPFVRTGKDGAPITQEFCDRGFMGLPLDNQMDDLLMPTWFTEMWVPFVPGDGRLQETITRLRRCFDADGSAEGAYAATGSFAFELYVGKADHHFFLSPATGSHVLRVDVFWFGNNHGNPVTDFYPRFWNALEPLGYRLHWGKFLPPPDPSSPDRLTSRYPHWERWNRVRARVDPAGLFLTQYWREHLGLGVEASVSCPGSSVAAGGLLVR